MMNIKRFEKMRRLLTVITTFIGVTVAVNAFAQTPGADRPAISGALTLDSAVKTGLRESLALRVSQADIKSATAATRIARSQKLPQLSATTYLTYGDFANIYNASPNVTPANSIVAPSQGYADQNFTLSVPLYTSGRLENQIRAASGRERAASLDLGEMRLEIALKIKEAYYRALLAGEGIKVGQARSEAAAELIKNAQALFEAGKGLQASVFRAEAEAADARRMLMNAENLQAKAMLEMKVEMGVRLDSDIRLANALEFVPTVQDLAAQLSEAARRRPGLQSANMKIAASRDETQAVKSSQGLQVYAVAMADGLISHPLGTREGYSVGLTLSLPILDGGRRRAETAQARALEDRLEAEERNLSLRIESEVREAWLDHQTANENYQSAISALKSAQSAYDVTALRVQNQKGLLIEQLDSQSALTQARLNVAQAIYERSVAIARLKRAVGSE